MDSGRAEESIQGRCRDMV
jgi:hypothetical protein